MALGIACGCLVTDARAGELGYSLGVRGESTDNVRRAPVNEEHESINAVLAKVSYIETSPTMNLRLAPSVEYLNYQKNTFDDESRVELDAVGVWKISPERVTWSFEDYARQVLLNPTLPETPANVTTANYFSTGPDFYAHLTPISTLQFGARYGRVTADDADVDSDRTQVYAHGVYRYSPRTTLSLNVDFMKADFDNKARNTDFTRRDSYVRAETQRQSSDVTLDLGVTAIERDRGDDVHEGLVRASWIRKLAPSSRVVFLAEAGLSDIGNELAASGAASARPLDGLTPSTSQNLLIEDVFRVQRTEFYYHNSGVRFGTTLRLFGRDLEFLETPADDREERGGGIELTYLYSRTVAAALFADRQRDRYQNQVLSDTDTSAGVRLSHRLSATLSLVIEVWREERDSTNPTREFVDDRAFIALLYKGGPAARER